MILWSALPMGHSKWPRERNDFIYICMKWAEGVKKGLKKSGYGVGIWG